MKFLLCYICILIAPSQQTKMGSQGQLGVYVGFNFPSIIRYLRSLIDKNFANHNFAKKFFLPLRGGNPILE